MGAGARTASDDEPQGGRSSPFRKKLIGLGRAFGGALIFALPMLMTMEFWFLGFTMDRMRLVLLFVLALPLLIGLAHRVGFEETFGFKEDFRDALIALGIGLIASALVLAVFNVIHSDMPPDEIIGKIALQAVPASIGALLGRSQLGASDGGEGEGDDGEGGEDNQPFSGYGGELFLMAVGALFLSLNIAPTDEMILISALMTPWHALTLVLLSILLMHAFVYAVAFKGGSGLARSGPMGTNFLHFTVVGYLLAALISAYVLWSFGRLDGLSLHASLMATVTLAFPAAIGAAAARLIL